MIAGSTALKRIQPLHNFYWRPVKPNFKGVNTIIRFEDNIWALQYTISRDHKPATDGLLEICDGMNHKRDFKWHLVLVGSELKNAKEARDNQQLAIRKTGSDFTDLGGLVVTYVTYFVFIHLYQMNIK
jgi:hypothetical protein